MERIVRLRMEEDDSIDHLNKLFDKGWKTIFTLPYKGTEFRNQFLIGLEMNEEDWDSHRFDVDDDEDTDDEKEMQ